MGNSILGSSGPANNNANMIQQFNQFRQSFTGDPKQAVMQLVQSGKMSNQQLQQLMSMANQMQHMFK